MYKDWLIDLEKNHDRIRIGLVGLGSMGKGIAYNVCNTPGMELVTIGDIDDKKVDDIKKSLPDYNFRVEDCHDVAKAKDIDVFIEASSSIKEGRIYNEEAILAGHDVVLMNGEVDCFYGPELFKLADKTGVVYSSTDGDQYGVLAKLIEEADLMGLETIMIGNVKGFLNRFATPESIKQEAAIRNLDPGMCVTYTDGTKLAIEMAIMSNATGFVPYKGHMEGPKMKDIKEVLKYYDFDSIKNSPCVEYVLGAEPGGGVFIVVECFEPYQQSMLKYYKMGDGPYYLMYRPYHLCHFETAYAICRVYFDEKPLLAPWHGRVSNVYSLAKKDLRPGEKIGGPGTSSVYGEIALQLEIDQNKWIPIYDVEGKIVKNLISAGTPIRMRDIEV